MEKNNLSFNSLLMDFSLETAKIVLSMLVEMERETGMVERDVLLEELKKHGIEQRETKRLIGQLIRDETIYSPREGYLKKT